MQAAATHNHTERRQPAYRLERVDFANVGPELMDRWRRLIAASPLSPMHDPGWLAESFTTGKERLLIYFLFDGDSLAGVAPFLGAAFSDDPRSRAGRKPPALGVDSECAGR